MFIHSLARLFGWNAGRTVVHEAGKRPLPTWSIRSHWSRASRADAGTQHVVSAPLSFLSDTAPSLNPAFHRIWATQLLASGQNGAIIAALRSQQRQTYDSDQGMSQESWVAAGPTPGKWPQQRPPPPLSLRLGVLCDSRDDKLCSAHRADTAGNKILKGGSAYKILRIYWCNSWYIIQRGFK